MSDEQVMPEDKSEHITLRVAMSNAKFDVEPETVIIEIHADNLLLGVAALSKLGRDEQYILSLFKQVLNSYADAYEEDDIWDEDRDEY